jgi:hypothetical protein
MFRFLFIALTLLLILPGCGDDSSRGRPEKVPVRGAGDAPPEITAQDIARKIILDSNLDFPIPPKGTRFPPAVQQNMIRMLELANSQHSLDPKGKEALGFVTQRVEKRVKEMERAESWEYVVGFIKAHRVMSPSSSKYNRLFDKAMVELRRPRISLSGIINHQGHRMATLQFYLPLTGQYLDEQMYVGDEKHGVKIINVFGDNLGVTVEYLETTEQYVIYRRSKL